MQALRCRGCRAELPLHGGDDIFDCWYLGSTSSVESLRLRFLEQRFGRSAALARPARSPHSINDPIVRLLHIKDIFLANVCSRDIVRDVRK